MWYNFKFLWHLPVQMYCYMSLKVFIGCILPPLASFRWHTLWSSDTEGWECLEKVNEWDSQDCLWAFLIPMNNNNNINNNIRGSVYLVSPNWTACPAHLNLLNITTLTNLSDISKSWSYLLYDSLCFKSTSFFKSTYFLHPFVFICL